MSFWKFLTPSRKDMRQVGRGLTDIEPHVGMSGWVVAVPVGGFLCQAVLCLQV